jgi:SPP1 gp7 family putative phage head morphogenesis protein
MPELTPLPFAEAIAWAKRRGVVLPDTYYGELQGFARAQAFSVASIAQLDQLKLVQDSLLTALEEGQSFQRWKKEALKPDSPLREFPRHRIENIFRTNLQGQYNRGRCEQQNRTRETFPWLLFDAVNDSRTRPSHAAMDGFVARYDDPIWNIWRPPAGYQCRCRVIALTEKQAQKYINADASRIANPEPQEMFGGLTYAQARAQALLDGPDEGWDYDICQNPDAGTLAAEQRATQSVMGTALAPALAARLENKPPVSTTLDFDNDQEAAEAWAVNNASVTAATQAQADILENYTGAAYTPINDALRRGETTPELEAFLSENLDPLIAGSSLAGDVIVHRGANLSKEAAATLTTDAVFTDRAYLSTSFSSDVAKRFTGKRGSTPVLFKITLSALKPALHVDTLLKSKENATMNESEALLPRNSEFRVTGTRQEGDFLIVEALAL